MTGTAGRKAAEEGGDTGLACLVLVAAYFDLPADPAALAQRHRGEGGTLDLAGLLAAARGVGLDARPVESDWERLARTPFPAVARGTDGAYRVVAGRREDRVLVRDPRDPGPRVLDRAAFLAHWSGTLVLFRRRPATGGAAAGGAARFGLGWFVPALAEHRRVLAEVLLASLFLQVLALLTPLFFQVVIDKVLVHRGLTTLDVLAVGLVVVSVFEAVLGAVRGYLFTHTTSRIDVALGTKLFRHVLALPVAYFAARRIGDTVARVRELETIRGFLTSTALTVVVDLLFTVVFVAVMFLYSTRLTWIVVGAMPLYLALSVLVTPVLRARLAEKFERGADSQAFLVESVSGIETLKSLAAEPRFLPRWEEQLAAYVRASFRAAHLGNVAGQTASLINKLTVVLILWIGARLVMEGALTVGQLVAFNMLAARTSGPVLRLVQIWQDFQQAGISLRRLGDVLDAPPEPGHGGGRTALPRIAGRVTFEGVTFRYRPDGPPALAGVDLELPPGAVVGVVGRSGSGKSTLGRLLQRLYAPESGRVLVDGVDLATVDPGWLRRQVAVVLQEGVLFNRSVRENIAIAEPGVSMDRVVAAARLAGAHDFVRELPEGYDTVVGEHGVALSGGQRQRIAIARALVGEPRILVLDEATSALDYESERVLHDNLDAIAAGRTLVIIAHRLSAVRRCRDIVVLERGRIVERGRHAELLARPGHFARLHAYQTGGPRAAAGRA